MKVLVTGGGGFLGSAIIDKLIKAGYEVTSFSRSEHENIKGFGAGFIQGDLKIAEQVSEAVYGMDAVIHTAAMVGYWGKYDDFYDVNVNGTKNIVHACRKNGIRNLVFTSSPSVIFNGKDMEGSDETVPYPAKYDSFYSKTKAIAERYLLSSNDTELRTLSLRPHLIWGPGDTHIIPGLIERAKQGKMIKVGDGKNIASTGRPYFITNGEPRNVWEFIGEILKAAGLGPIKRSVPAGPALAYGVLLETYYKVFRKGKEPPLSRFLVKELITSHWYDISAARKELGYEPKVTMDEGLKRLKDWFDRNPQ
jgi:nucleoside-diphosphate-sugar epimerase